MTTFDFLLSLVVTLKVLAYTRGITVSLQRSTMNQMQAYREVNDAIAALEQSPSDVESYHEEWLIRLLTLDSQLG